MSEPQTDQVASSEVSDGQSGEPAASGPASRPPPADAPVQSDAPPASASADVAAMNAQVDAATAEFPTQAEPTVQPEVVVHAPEPIELSAPETAPEATAPAIAPDIVPPDATAPAAPPEAAPSQALTADAMPLVQVIEALLFATDIPLSPAKLAETVGVDSTKPVKAVIDELNAGYQQRQAAYRIEERAGGYQLLTLPQYAEYIERLVRRKDEGRLTPASLETLAIVAYKQPIIRADVEAIRGVACGDVLRSLMEHNLVKIVGRAEIVGRPMLYGTTRYFLEVFGLANLKDLPKSEQLKEPK